ncbi:MAG: DUF4347 domain-containing protein [Cyanobacteria bacterium P01_F01_bin.13]
MSTNNTVPQGSLTPTSIAFVDDGIAQSEELLKTLQTDRVFLLNDQSSGVEQITQTLAQYSDLESVHIFSHGSQGKLQLGNTILNQTNLTDYQAELESWQTAFSHHGDLLFYGCNLAAADGSTFVEQISQLTQADVAASNNLTGHSSLGGDWELEVHFGHLETAAILNNATQATYVGLLATALSLPAMAVALPVPRLT